MDRDPFLLTSTLKVYAPIYPASSSELMAILLESFLIAPFSPLSALVWMIYGHLTKGLYPSTLPINKTQ